MSFLAFALELYFAATLGVSGLAKVDNPQYFAQTITQQQLAPSWSIPLITRILPWIECVLAALLLTNIEPIITSILLASLFLFFLIVKIVLLATGRTKDCGCFGSTKPQNIDGINITVSFLLTFLAFTHLWLIIQFPSVNWQWRFACGILFAVGWSHFFVRIMLKSRKNSYPMPTHSMDLGGISLGEKAPSFIGIDQNNQTMRLDMFKGNWLLLLFVSPGCSACPGGLKALHRISLENPIFSVVAIASPDLEVNSKYAIKQQIEFPIITSTSELVHKHYKVRVFPFVFVLDEEGIIQARGVASTYDSLQSILHTVNATREFKNTANIE